MFNNKKSLYKIKTFSYIGSKQKYNDIIQNKINASNRKIYIEPFLGSGFIFLNLQKEFNFYYLAEKNENILNFWKQMLNVDIKYVQEFYIDLEKRFNYNTYEGFYNLRKYYNKNFYNTNTLDESLILVAMIQNSIRNMTRFGKMDILLLLE